MAFSNQQQEWIDHFVTWAESRDDIRTALVFGSQAKKNNDQIDEWADIDIAIFTSRSGLYTKGHTWMQDISPMWSGLVDTSETWSGLAAASGFSVYRDGLIVDFIILPKMRVQLANLCIQLLNLRPSVWRHRQSPIIEFCNQLLGFFRRGVIVLVDKDGLADRLEQVTMATPLGAQTPPSANELQKNSDDFWVDPPRVVTSLRRGKLVWATRSTRPMMKQLYKMAEWHARAKRGWDDGTEFPLKGINGWADSFVLDALPRIYARYDEEDMWHALLEMINLYRRLTAKTAELLGYELDIDTAMNVSEWVHKCYEEREG